MRYIQDPITFKLIPADEYRGRAENKSAYVQGDIDAFVSPIDKSVINDRKKLRDHNRAHGVTDSRDYSSEYMRTREKARHDEITGNTKSQKRARIEAIKRAIYQHEAR